MSAHPTIAIAGAGAVGTLVAYRLVAASVPVTLVARGQRAIQLRDGLRLDDGPPLAASVVTASDLQPHDVVIVAVKEGSLATMLAEVSHALRPETLVIPLVNGVPFWFNPAACDAIAARIIGAVTYVMASLDHAGCAQSGGMEKLVLGAPDAHNDEAIANLAAVLSSAGIATRVTGNIRAEVWSKIALNLSTNPLSVVTGTTLQGQFDDPDLSSLVSGILQETIALARATGVEPSMTLDEMLAVGRKAGPVRTSMLQDHLAGRPLELDAIAHSCLAMAREKGMAMPMTEAIIRLAQSKDKIAG